MQGKGLTPNQLKATFVDAHGNIKGTDGPFTGLADCIKAINCESAYEPELSYYIAYRTIRKYGVYTEQVISKEVQADGTHHALIIIIAAVEGHEVKPGFALAQEPAKPAPAPLFEVEDTASLADLAKDINQAARRNKKKVAPAQSQASEVVAPAQSQASEVVAPAQDQQLTWVHEGPAKAHIEASKASGKAGTEPGERMYKVVYRSYTEAGNKSTGMRVYYIMAETKHLAKQAVRKLAAGRPCFIQFVEPAPAGKVASKKFLL